MEQDQNLRLLRVENESSQESLPIHMGVVKDWSTFSANYCPEMSEATWDNAESASDGLASNAS